MQINEYKLFEIEHKLFEINDLNNIIINYLTIGEKQLLKGKRCTRDQLIETVKTYLASDFCSMAYDILTFNHADYMTLTDISHYILQEYNKNHLSWFCTSWPKLPIYKYYELVEGKISLEPDFQNNDYISRLWILFTSNMHQNNIFPHVKTLTVISAAIYGHYDIVKLLIENCNQININKMVDVYEMMNKFLYYKFDWRILKFLVDKNMIINEYVLICVAKYGDISMFDYLETKGSLNFIDRGYSIAYAASRGDINMVKYLLKRNVYIDTDFISWPAANNQFEMVKYVIDETEFGKKHIRGYTIKNDTIRTGNIDMIEYLFQKIEREFYDSELVIFIQIAIEMNNLKLVKYLQNKFMAKKIGTNMNTIMDADQNTKLVISLLYETIYPCDIVMFDYIKNNFKFVLKSENNEIIMKTLRDNNYDVLIFLLEIEISKKELLIIFRHAIMNNNNKMFKFLLQKCGDVALVDLSCDIVENAFKTCNKTIINWISGHEHTIICNNCLHHMIIYGKERLFKHTIKERQKRNIFTDFNELLRQTKIYNRQRVTKFIKGYIATLNN